MNMENFKPFKKAKDLIVGGAVLASAMVPKESIAQNNLDKAQQFHTVDTVDIAGNPMVVHTYDQNYQGDVSNNKKWANILINLDNIKENSEKNGDESQMFIVRDAFEGLEGYSRGYVDYDVYRKTKTTPIQDKINYSEESVHMETFNIRSQNRMFCAFQTLLAGDKLNNILGAGPNIYFHTKDTAMYNSILKAFPEYANTGYGDYISLSPPLTAGKIANKNPNDYYNIAEKVLQFIHQKKLEEKANSQLTETENKIKEIDINDLIGENAEKGRESQVYLFKPNEDQFFLKNFTESKDTNKVHIESFNDTLKINFNGGYINLDGNGYFVVIYVNNKKLAEKLYDKFDNLSNLGDEQVFKIQSNNDNYEFRNEIIEIIDFIEKHSK